MLVPNTSPRLADTDEQRTLERVVSLGVVVGGVAAVLAGATVWLLLTDPMSVTNAVGSSEMSPLVLRLAGVIYSAIAQLLEYL